MSIIQLSPQLHLGVNLFKKLGTQANIHVSKQELELIKKNFDKDSGRIIGDKPDIRAYW